MIFEFGTGELQQGRMSLLWMSNDGGYGDGGSGSEQGRQGGGKDLSP